MHQQSSRAASERVSFARRRAQGLLAALLAAFMPLHALAACAAGDSGMRHVSSGTTTAALVELYTSQGCSSCPPAERLLSRLPQVLPPGADAYALALHVNYWDALGWKDRFAQEAFSVRHQDLVHANAHTVVYTPHFFVSGTEKDNDAGELRAQVQALNGQPAPAKLRLDVRANADSSLHVSVAAEARGYPADAALYLAVAQNGVVADIARGENRGARLLHDHVVREWVGPLPLEAGEARLEHDTRAGLGGTGTGLEVLAFVQDKHNGHVLQALGTPVCALAANAARAAPVAYLWNPVAGER